MHRSVRSLCAAALVVLGACAEAPVPDTGLNTDVALADQLARRNTPALQAAPPSSPEAIPTANPPEAQPVVARSVSAPASAPTIAGRRGVTRVAVAPRARVEAPAREASTSGASAGEVASAAPAEVVPVVDGAEDREPIAPAEPSSGAYGAPAPRPQAHVTRDAVLGTLAGAVLGAATGGHDRVRGGLIGAVAGGALGAVYGSMDRSAPTGYGPRTYASAIPGATRIVRRSRYPGTI